LIAVVLLGGCRRTPYRSLGCDEIQRLPPIPATPYPPWSSDHGVACIVSDAAPRAPSCDAVAAVFRAIEHPAWNYGIVVGRRSGEIAVCSGMYAPTGARIADLPNVD
jgi:hypothetical protein